MKDFGEKPVPTRIFHCVHNGEIYLNRNNVAYFLEYVAEHARNDTVDQILDGIADFAEKLRLIEAVPQSNDGGFESWLDR